MVSNHHQPINIASSIMEAAAKATEDDFDKIFLDLDLVQIKEIAKKSDVLRTFAQFYFATKFDSTLDFAVLNTSINLSLIEETLSIFGPIATTVVFEPSQDITIGR